MDIQAAKEFLDRIPIRKRLDLSRFCVFDEKTFSEAIGNYYPICYNYTYQEEERVERLKASIKFKR